AQWHYPFENKEVFEKNFPADFIAEGVDQTRGWFYTLHAIAVMAFDSVSFKNVVSNGLVLDAEGNKMSKSKGNVLDPFKLIETHSADVTRWYMMSNANPWDNLKFDVKGMEEVQRKFFGTLYNTYSFFALYANIDQFYNKQEQALLAERPEIDRWIISLLNSLVKEVDADYADYEPTQAARKVQNFVNDNLSNWYVRLCRRRFWKPSQQQNGQSAGMDADKLAAYQTLYECLVTVAKLMAPAAPFFADWLYRNLNEASGLEHHESVHLADFPTANETVIDKNLEQRMDYAQRISSLALSLRKKEKIRVRQPLHKILLPILDGHFREQVEEVKSLVLSEINVKDIEYVTDTSGILKKKIKPNFKTLGRRLGKDMKAAAQAIGNMGQEDIARIEKTKQYILEVDGARYELTLEDFEITAEDIPGWQVASDDNITVALDITLDEELEAEGMARDIVNRIQNIRKDKDFEVTDKIRVALQKDAELAPAVEKYGEYIKAETLATELQLMDEVADGEEIELPGEVKVRIRVRKQ
ncbi:MAG: class I tRNA ligase family protein, partial [Phaeodactylibacter sp.]|nr:class I tRNA ligase family protein [Phaeodactylibacter sp.]